MAQMLVDAVADAVLGKNWGIDAVVDGGDFGGKLQKVGGTLRFFQSWGFGCERRRGIILVFAAEV